MSHSPSLPPTASASPCTESEWIERAQAGSLDAFNQLVLTHQDAALRLAQWMLNDEAMAEDIVQNAFIAAYRSLKEFRCQSFRGWLLKMVRNASIDELRRRRRHPWLGLEAHNDDGEEVETPHWLVDPRISPEDALVQREAWERLEASLRQLSSPMREVIVLIDIEELDYSEAASILGIPLGTVKSRIGRARASLRQILKKSQPPLAHASQMTRLNGEAAMGETALPSFSV
jgi:RNA polymerase sigma-70 factor, ECF subfamily